MDSQDIFIKPQEQIQDQIQEKTKKKQKKPMTPERKEVLLENLRKGRAKYLGSSTRNDHGSRITKGEFSIQR